MEISEGTARALDAIDALSLRRPFGALNREAFAQNQIGLAKRILIQLRDDRRFQARCWGHTLFSRERRAHEMSALKLAKFYRENAQAALIKARQEGALKAAAE